MTTQNKNDFIIKEKVVARPRADDLLRQKTGTRSPNSQDEAILAFAAHWQRPRALAAQAAAEDEQGGPCASHFTPDFPQISKIPVPWTTSSTHVASTQNLANYLSSLSTEMRAALGRQWLDDWDCLSSSAKRRLGHLMPFSPST
jgi:hypothetical protein